MTPSIVVFGAGPGLGRSVARRYARSGCTVVLVARRQPPLAMPYRRRQSVQSTCGSGTPTERP
jgi:NAD(P)-dependent dehydrogenase (short-subunit alcohol dehydrogenase family)